MDDPAGARPLRFVTATSLFDGHDASINLIRRLLQRQGCEVVHLGHNRSVAEIADAAVDEDVHGVAVSSYQGGHMEFFAYLVEELARRDRPQVRVFGGGGGVIIPKEIAELEALGVAKVFSPDDGARLGLEGMAAEMCDLARTVERPAPPGSVEPLLDGDRRQLARAITAIEAGALAPELLDAVRGAASARAVPVLGITGTGGSGKSSLTDELVQRFRLDLEDKLRIAVVAVDPTRRRGGGALLGDRIRMNAIDTPQVFFRSLGAGGAPGGLPAHLDDVVAACRAWGADLVVVETPGIGQGDAGIEAVAGVSLYVMTPEYGAPTQLEKIEMLDVADAVAINKFERRGANDALREVRRQLARLRGTPPAGLEALPVFGTVAARFNDDGVTALYHELRRLLAPHGLTAASGVLADPSIRASTHAQPLIAPDRVGYLGEIARAVRAYHVQTERLARDAAVAWALDVAADELAATDAAAAVRAAADGATAALDPSVREALAAWPARAAALREPTATEAGRPVALQRTTLSGSAVPRVATPRGDDPAALVRFLRGENLPGSFPFTAGVFAFKRDDEDPTRMFAGEGDAARTNRRFHLLADGQPSTRLSTAFDSVTLYGFDPDERPDIFGKVGNAGVSVATIEDMAVLYGGFDLCDPSTSVSMTINGPAPTILAMFLNVAADQHVAAAERRVGHALDEAAREAARQEALATVRGTVQADILKEDQGQNTCILSTEFALRMMGDVQQYFIDHRVRNFYSVSISGYHIAEAGANPITQLALTLSNGFTYVESWLARGMDVEAFAPSLSFFFSNGMDAEYTVLGRVARRIWAVVMRERYGASARAQKLKYHVQTSGRSLHAQEMAFNDIRTTLQALCAIYDNCNSLHTNAFDEAVTTPTGESVRRAMAIQLIINREWGLAGCDNPLQGSYVVEELTDLVEEAVLTEFERINERGGVLGAMELGYQRGRIQDESMAYEQRKHDGSLPIVGVNTFLDPDAQPVPDTMELARSTLDERTAAVERVRAFQVAHATEREAALDRLRQAALEGSSTFEVLMDAVRCCTLGEITDALFEVGGRYRRNL